MKMNGGDGWQKEESKKKNLLLALFDSYSWTTPAPDSPRLTRVCSDWSLESNPYSSKSKNVGIMACDHKFDA